MGARRQNNERQEFLGDLNDEYLVYYINGYGCQKDGKYVFKIKKHAENDWRAYYRTDA